MSFAVPQKTFFDETFRFLAAQNLILRSNIVGREGHEELRKSYLNLEEAVKPSYKDAYTYLSSRLFLAYVSSFEVFLQELVTLVVRKHPKKIGTMEFSLSEILDTPDTEVLILRAIEDYLNRLMFKRPMEYLKGICELLSISSDSVASKWPIYVEAKARRDLGVHANWRCNATYIRKVSEAGLTSSLQLGESAVPDGSSDYLDSIAKDLQDLSEVFTSEVIRKYGE